MVVLVNFHLRGPDDLRQSSGWQADQPAGDASYTNSRGFTLVGPRQCGKTTLLRTLPAPWKIHDLELAADHLAVASDPDLFLRLNPGFVAIDEAQELPALFPALRVAIDEQRDRKGRFVITGSSSPDLLGSISESLAGRVAIVEMAPLSWAEVAAEVRAESGTMGPMVSRLAQADTQAEDLLGLTPRGTIAEVHDYWFQGGFPEPWLHASPRFRHLWMENYQRTYLFRDVARLFPGLNRDRFRIFVQMLAGLSGTILNYSEVARALGVSQPTARDYFQIAHGTFLWRQMPSYQRNAVKRVVKHPRGHLRDSGLLHHLLRLPDRSALLTHPQIGRSWEGMVIEEIIRQLGCGGVGFEAYYYRTSAGAEVDLVLEGAFGLLPIEIKHTQTVDPRGLRSLRRFVQERGCALGVVVNNDRAPRLYAPDIVGVPFACL